MRVGKAVRALITEIKGMILTFLFYLFRIFPLQNKIVATTFRGRKYGDNPQFILEELRKIHPEWDYVWECNPKYSFSVPEGIRKINRYSTLRTIYEYSTAKVWINTHRLGCHMRKRKGQLFIETWHGGLGIKKIEGDVPKFKTDKYFMKQVKNTSDCADVYISNSDHLTELYRRAFCYHGPVWKCGYPKNDILFTDKTQMKNKIHEYYGLSHNTKILLYAPTFRDSLFENNIDLTVYNIDYKRLKETITDKFGGSWVVLVRMHPFLSKRKELSDINETYTINVTDYPDMQELILSCDMFISDYSSCIFDAAITGIPCFTFATDFEDYKSDRGVYYEMDELPFPYAKNNDELMQNIENFNADDYSAKWKAFAERTGLHETGHAAKDIAEKIIKFINGEKVIWE